MEAVYILGNEMMQSVGREEESDAGTDTEKTGDTQCNADTVR